MHRINSTAALSKNEIQSDNPEKRDNSVDRYGILIDEDDGRTEFDSAAVTSSLAATVSAAAVAVASSVEAIGLVGFTSTVRFDAVGCHCSYGSTYTGGP